jgi:hypothetical protein
VPPVSNVGSGAVWTLVIPLSLLVLVLAIWAFAQRRALTRRPRGESTRTDA